MSTVTISAEKLSEAVEQELTIYNQTVIDGIKKQAKKSMSELVKRTKETAPVGNREKHYKDSIKSKKVEDDRSVICTWYVDGADYRLSHLLENGHALRNGGRTEGTHFIQKASDPILAQYIEAVEEVLKRG